MVVLLPFVAFLLLVLVLNERTLALLPPPSLRWLECADTPIQLAAATVAGALQEGQEVTGHFSFAAMEVQVCSLSFFFCLCPATLSETR